MLGKPVLAVVVLALRAGAATIPIAVGRNGLTFTPNTVTATEGDVLEFRFWARNHSVVQGTWSTGCVPESNGGGFFSGFFPTPEGGPNNNVFLVTVNNTDPIVIYCSQNTGSHCKNGMAAVINPSGSSNLQNYLTLAKSASTAQSPPSVFGGIVDQLSRPTATSGIRTTTRITSTRTRATTATASEETETATSTESATTATSTAGSDAERVGVSFAAAVAGIIMAAFV